MLLEFLKYATRLLKNNMTTIILGTTTTSATIIATTTTTSSITTNINLTTNASTISNIHNVTPLTSQPQLNTPPQNANVMLPERPAATYPTFDIYNSTFKTFVNKTFDNVVQANFSNYTDYTNDTPFTNTLMPPIVNVSEANTVGSGMTANATTATTTSVMSALSTLPATRYAMETTTSFPAQTVATFMAAGNKNRATIIVYPTVSPESIVIPIVSCIFGFPILAFLVICCLRRRAKLARERDRRRNYDMQDHAVSLVRFSPIHRLNYRPTRAISLRPERSLSQGFTSLELDTVVEERCSDIEQTQTEILNAESPMETTSSNKMSFSS